MPRPWLNTQMSGMGRFYLEGEVGTNFYWREMPGDEDIPSDDMNPEFHIGKRSAAGPYCWDCDVTLIAGGNAEIHTGDSHALAVCPSCGAPRGKGSLVRGAAAIELGFAQPETERPSGIGTCSSFTWAQDPESVGVKCQQEGRRKLVQDEYGRRYTGRQFLTMLQANCPVQFTDSIGRWFC